MITSRRIGLRVALALLFTVSSLFAVACRKSSDATPEGALNAWVSAMNLSRKDVGARKQAYAILSARTQQSLTARASRASQLSGRSIHPWEMLAPGRFLLRGAFEPWENVRLSSRIEGDRAVVTVVGRGDERAEVKMVREQGAWRVDLVLPEMQPILVGSPDGGTGVVTVPDASPPSP